MRLAQCNKRRAYGKILHESDGRFGMDFSLSGTGIAPTHTINLSIADTTSEDSNRYYRLDLPRDQAVNLMAHMMSLLMEGPDMVKQAQIQRALKELGLKESPVAQLAALGAPASLPPGEHFCIRTASGEKERVLNQLKANDPNLVVDSVGNPVTIWCKSESLSLTSILGLEGVDDAVIAAQ